MNCTEIHQLIGGDLKNPIIDYQFTGIASPKNATQEDVVFIFNNSIDFSEIRSKLIILKKHQPSFSGIQIVHLNPRLAMAKLLKVFYPSVPVMNKVSHHSEVHESVSLDSPVEIAAFVSIGQHSSLGADTRIHSSVTIGKHCKIGRGCVIHPNVTLYDYCSIGDYTTVHANTTIGTDGFGYEKNTTHWEKITHIGGVKIGNNVEIGSHVTINRGCLDQTIVSDGVKIDDQVHIAHNIKIGENTVIAGGSLLGGSSVVGKNCILAGNVSLADNITVNDDAIILAKSGVTKDVPKGCIVSGFPAQEHKQEMKFQAYLKQLFKRKN